jgi:hypothetical protein
MRFIRKEGSGGDVTVTTLTSGIRNKRVRKVVKK